MRANTDSASGHGTVLPIFDPPSAEVSPRSHSYRSANPMSPRRILLSVVLGSSLIACGLPPDTLSSPSTTDSMRTSTTLEGSISNPSPQDVAEVRRAVWLSGAIDQPPLFVLEGRFITIGDQELSLDETPLDALAGSLVPWVVPATADEFLYTTWTEREDLEDIEIGQVGGVPAIRIFNVLKGTDDVFRPGSYAPTVSAAGRIAYTRDVDGVYRYSVPNPSQIWVTAPDSDKEEAWSDETDIRYIAVGWSGDTLIVYEVSDGEHIATLAFEGPGSSVLLSPNGVVAAISPDGSRILLVEPDEAGLLTRFVIMDPSGRRITEVMFDTSLGPVNGTYLGDWQDNRIVIGPGTGNGEQFPYTFGFTLLTFEDDHLTFDRFVAIDNLDGMVSLTNPRFTSGGAIWLRITQGGAPPDNDSYRSFDAVCSDLGQCQRTSEVQDVREAGAIIHDVSGGSR